MACGIPAAYGIPALWRRALLRVWPAALARCAPHGDRELGQLGEELAARWLRSRGATIVARGLRCDGVELDIVAREAGLHVIVEVKTARLPELEGSRGRDGRPGLDARFRPGLRVDARRVARLYRAARAFARAQRVDERVRAAGNSFRIDPRRRDPSRMDPCGANPFRIDLVEVGLGPRGRIEIRLHRDLRRAFGGRGSNAALDGTVAF